MQLESTMFKSLLVSTLCFTTCLYLLVVCMMRRSILRCADCIILSCSFGGCPCSRCVALRRSYCCVEQSGTVFGQVVFRCQFLPVFGERLPSSGWLEVWARLSPQLPITSFINLADGSNSAFAANVHRLLGRRCRLCAPPTLFFPSSSPVSNASLVIDDSSFRQINFFGCCTVRSFTGVTTCRWPPIPSCAIVVCCYCRFRCS